MTVCRDVYGKHPCACSDSELDGIYTLIALAKIESEELRKAAKGES